LYNKQRASIFGPSASLWRDISDLARIDVFAAIVLGSNTLEIFSTGQEHILEEIKSRKATGWQESQSLIGWDHQSNWRMQKSSEQMASEPYECSVLQKNVVSGRSSDFANDKKMPQPLSWY
jgi:hypothetical protein